jgi:hypothetical protein
MGTDNIYDYPKDLEVINDILSGHHEIDDQKTNILTNLWSPDVNEGLLSLSKLAENPSFLAVLDKDALGNCDATGLSYVYSFVHACLVGANKGETNLNTQSTEPQDIYKNIFWTVNDSLTPQQAAKELMKTVAMFQLYTFQRLTNFISDTREMYKYANKTAQTFDGYDFSSSPVLPLTTTGDQYNIGVPGFEDGLIASIFPGYVSPIPGSNVR